MGGARGACLCLETFSLPPSLPPSPASPPAVPVEVTATLVASQNEVASLGTGGPQTGPSRTLF